MLKLKHKNKAFLGTFLVLLFFWNCSASNSISTTSTSLNSISSISNSLTSISGSISTAVPDSKYGIEPYSMDVRDLTILYARKGLEGDFEKDVSEVARREGVLEWKKKSFTYEAIGQGLKLSGMDNKEFQKLKKEVFNKNSQIAFYLQRGY
ncbi:MAG: putative lipoprotein, partial [Leptospiraceae bacterium]|nr:putative lipoprotein [Leptospiraceae bacterium]